MRLFVGLFLPSEVKDELYKVQRSFPREVAKVNWISKKNLHLTLKFLGEVKESEVPKIVSLLKKVKFDPFEVSTGYPGMFSRNNSPSVIWVDLVPKKKVIELQQKVDAELLSVFSSEQKFSPHLTLGRVKTVKKKDRFSKSFEEIKIQKKKFLITEFCLVQSKLTKDGPKYIVLERFDT